MSATQILGNELRSVRQSARKFLTTFSLFTSVPPQHETDDDTERKSGCHRCNRALRDQRLNMIFLLARVSPSSFKAALIWSARASARLLAASNAPSPVLFKRRDTSLLSVCSSSLKLA